MMTRILIVDDHAVVREGTRQLLEREADLVVVGETGSGEEAIQLAVRLRPDVILLDLALPDLNGIEVARQLRRTAPESRVVVLSAYENESYVRTAIEAGAVAYLLKTMHGQEVIDAIRAARTGQVILHPAIAAKLQRSLQRHGRADHLLSVREREILQLAAKGQHNKVIAEALFISVRTVESHLSHILEKLNVGSRTEAVAYGAAHGWIVFEEPGSGGEDGPPVIRGEDMP
jgi:DNA-binding NarL/FixJ family response regulator